MRRVTRPSLRPVDHVGNRKTAVEELLRPTIISAEAVLARAGNYERLDDKLTLIDLALPFFPKDVRCRVACLNSSCHAAFRNFAEAASPQRDSRVAVELASLRSAKRVAAVPDAYAEALSSYRGQPPQSVLAMSRLVVPVIEGDPQLCELDDGGIAWKLLQGHLLTTFAEPAPGGRNAFLAYLQSFAQPVPANTVSHAVAAAITAARVSVDCATDDPAGTIAAYVLSLCRVALESYP
jgi:hypothetical protein